MITWQDLEEIGEDKQARAAFVLRAINEHKSSELYKTAVDAEEYYKQLNPTIRRFQKKIYNLAGKAVPDIWAVNHKIASNFFNFAVTQENQYLLGNGVTFSNEMTKERLGSDFDNRVKDAGLYALIGGVSFTFFNLNHLEVFKVTEFAPLYDEETGALKAGVRFWQLAPEKPLRATLYELDGYTEYIRTSDEIFKEKADKAPYIQIMQRSKADGERIVDGRNYAGFPIVPLWGNDKKQSELVGKQNTIDAFDLMQSGFVNNVDEGNYIYWLIKNAGGMDDTDLAQFVERMKFVHAASVNAEAGNDVEARTIETPYGASTAVLAVLKQQLYEDFQCLNIANLSAASKTATEIRAAYQPLDSKCDAYEYQLVEYIKGLLELVGIDDAPTFKRSRIINQNEEIQTLLQCSQYIDSDTITQQICAVLGIADQYQDIIKKLTDEETERFNKQLEELNQNILNESEELQENRTEV